MSKKHWEERYLNQQTGWDRGHASPQLNRWLQGELREPGKIFVPGCGFGHEVLALARAGFEVTALDFAEPAIAHLHRERERQGLSFEIVEGDIFAFSPQGGFDLVYEQTCLCAIDPTQWTTYEQLLCCWLRPQGRVLAMFMQTDRPEGPPFHCSLEAMRELFSETRWIWPEEISEVPHPSGMCEKAVVLTRRDCC